jgi:hypothetical protein
MKKKWFITSLIVLLSIGIGFCLGGIDSLKLKEEKSLPIETMQHLQKEYERQTLIISNEVQLEGVIKTETKRKNLFLIDTIHIIKSIVIPENLLIDFGDKGAFNIGNSGSVEIKKIIYPEYRRIFFGNGIVRITAKEIRDVVPEWWGAVGDSIHDNTDAFKQMFLCQPSNVLIPQGIYLFKKSICIEDPIIFKGQGRKFTKLIFNAEGNKETFLFVGNPKDGSKPPNGTILSNFTISGFGFGIGMSINQGGPNPNLARNRFENIMIQDFNTGIQSKGFTTSIVENIDIRKCNLGWDFQMGNNNLDLQGVRFSNCGKFFEADRCQGLNFSSPLFQTIDDTLTDYAFSIRRSNVIMTNPYMEQIKNAEIGIIGGKKDSLGSSCIITGGILPSGKNIEYEGNARHAISVFGTSTSNRNKRINIITKNQNQWYYLPDYKLVATNDNVESLQGDTVLFEYKQKTEQELSFYNDKEPLLLSDNCIKGEVYTLIYEVKKSKKDQQCIALGKSSKNSIINSKNDFSETVSIMNDPWEIRKISFISQNRVLLLSFGTDAVKIRQLKLVKGCVSN